MMWWWPRLACVVMGALVASVAACGGDAAPRGACPGSSASPRATLPAARGMAAGALRWAVTLSTCTESRPAAAVDVQAGGAVYVVAGGTLRAIDAASGEVRWQSSLPGVAAGVRRQWHVQQVQGTVMVIASESRPATPDVLRRQSVIGFDASTGARRYDRVLKDWGTGDQVVQFLSPGYDLDASQGAVTIDGDRVGLLDPVTGLPLWTATLPDAPNNFWDLLSAGGVAYAQTTQSAETDRIPRIDLASGALLPPLVLAGGPTDAVLEAVLGDVLLFEGDGGAFAVRASDGSTAWRIPPQGASPDHLAQYDDVLGAIDPISRLSVAARRDGHGFAVYDLDTGAWVGRWPGDWSSETPVRLTRSGRLTVIVTAGATSLLARDAAGHVQWRSPTLPDWDLVAQDGYLTASGGMLASFVCTHLPAGGGCASYDLVGVEI